MELTKKAVFEFLKEAKLAEDIRNLQVMGKEVHLDMVSHNPTMHERKRIEKAVEAIVNEHFPEAVLKLKIQAEAKPTNPTIKGQPLDGVKNIIAVASGKGGVGKSTVAANLAVTLSKMGFAVGLLDADIYGPSMPTMFDVEESKPRAVEVNSKSLMEPVEAYGVKILSIGFFAGANQAVVWRGPMASKALTQMIRDANWGDLDFLLVDLPPGTGDVHLSLVQQIPITGAVIVSTPQKVALADAKKGVAMFKMDAIDVPVLGMIENMAYFTPAELPDHKYYIFGRNGLKNLTEQMNLDLLGEVPIVQSIREAGDAGRPAALQENTPVAEAFKSITQNLVVNLVHRNEHMPPTEAVRITTMAGCSAVKKK